MKDIRDEVLLFLKSIKSELFADGIVSLGLFGSLAKGTANKNSDIDIVYETSQEFVKKIQRLECIYIS